MSSTKKSSKKEGKRTPPGKKAYQLCYKICVSGAAETGHCAEGASAKAEEVGREIAKRGFILMTGATHGIPQWAAKGAKEAGGMVIGLSPAATKRAHVKKYRLPTDYHDLIIYTGFEYSGRNLLLTRSSDAVITICGRVGTLNEFTIAFENGKPSGVLEGTGGAADMIRDLLRNLKRGTRGTVFSHTPADLVYKVAQLIEEENKDLDT